jgi:hypothetical protein
MDRTYPRWPTAETSVAAGPGGGIIEPMITSEQENEGFRAAAERD